ncbi:hypothetical protein KFZ56_16870 [Virgibacillus sp. NKC19-3]|uniref:hypothetical protein n=1 Tax=Virgibacillus saliphilus TaxID=2831674 RepID=UPI001C9B12E6|nr:hypothetical protein [Virgibacillus sp. NKC19-3]MBY7144694.1 hypothetical protein [Virgibacillus sp. NKC19-3]
MSLSRVMRWITGILEALLGIPILGGVYVLSQVWTPLVVMLFLHIITWVLTYRDRGITAGSILGIITSLIAWIPFVGMIMHILTAIVLIIIASRPDFEQRS